jgi:phosphatidylglycerophosphate synthase
MPARRYALSFCVIASLSQLGGLQRDTFWQAVMFVGAMAGIQLRLLCNMLDGMVAVEHKMHSKTGELYNEVPGTPFLTTRLLYCM